MEILGLRTLDMAKEEHTLSATIKRVAALEQEQARHAQRLAALERRVAALEAKDG